MTDTVAQGTGAAVEPGGESAAITWQGSPWSLAGLGLFNFLLGLVTFGIYSFWGRTEVRRRIWSSVRLNGEPFEYTGTGKELFIGFLVVFAVLLLPVTLFGFALYILAGPLIAITAIYIIAYVVFPYLFGVAIYRARRYRLSRTRWRGIRGALVGNDWTWGWGYFWTAVVSILAGGWLQPWRTNYLYRNMTKDTRFGDRAFSYKGRAGPLYPPFALAWVGGIIAMIGMIGGIMGYLYLAGKLPIPDGEGGVTQPPPTTLVDNMVFVLIVMAMAVFFSLFVGWYHARVANVLTGGTTYEGLRFKADVKGGGMIWLLISNYLMTALSLGILKPVADARYAKFLIDRTTIEGTVDFAAIAQSQAALDKRGEGLASAFELDAIG
jgi:uncharacterized membrane protein YjgN (DUF898 family)